MEPIDIILITCNRVERTTITINEFYKRLKTPFRLIVVDNESVDGTYKYLQEERLKGRVHVLNTCPSELPITMSYNIGFKHVESEFFICSQDDITVPQLDPCVISQLITLMEKYPEQGAIGLRIQRVPNMDWSRGNEELAPARKALSAYFRIQRRSDFKKLGENPFGTRQWDDLAFVQQVRGKLGKECSWTKNLWADHSRGYCVDRGYIAKPRKWGFAGGIHSRMNQAIIRKPYPKINKITNTHLAGEKMYK
jgi:GT2 family glycosyltransferase